MRHNLLTLGEFSNWQWATLNPYTLLGHFNYFPESTINTRDAPKKLSHSLFPPVLYSPHGNALNPEWVQLVGQAINAFFVLCMVIQLGQLVAQWKSPRTAAAAGASSSWLHRVKHLQLLIQVTVLSVIYALTSNELVSFSLVATVVAAGVQVLEYRLSPVALASVLLYWLVNFIFGLVILVQDVASKHKIIAPNTVNLVLEIVALVNGLIIFVLETFFYSYGDTTTSASEANLSISRVNFISYFTFSFIQPVLNKAYTTDELTMDELPNVIGNLKSDETTATLKKNWQHELRVKSHIFAKIGSILRRRKYKNTPNLLSAVYKSNASYVWGNLIFSLSDIVFSFSQPFILMKFIGFFTRYVDSEGAPHERPPVIIGYFWAFAMLFTKCADFISFNQAIILQMKLGYSIRSSLTVLIYEKSLKLSPASKKKKPTGDIVNNISVDVGRINSFTQGMSDYVTAPIKLVVCVTALFKFFGYASFFGVGAALLSAPLILLIQTAIMASFKQLMKDKDDRTSLVTEIINSAKSIKLYSWETPMLKRLNHIRNDRELQNYKRIGVIFALVQFLWGCVPFLISCACFTAFIKLYNVPLTPEIVFPALALFGLLMEPMALIPNCIMQVLEVRVSLGRLTEFMTLEEISSDQNGKIRREDAVKNGNEAVVIRNADFVWNENAAAAAVPEYKDEESEIQNEENNNNNTLALKDINFTALKGKLTCVVGKVGSGKSTLINAILGDVPVKAQTYSDNAEQQSSSPPLVETFGTIAYCPQNPWILNGTIKENILFGHKYDSEFYRKTIIACQLVPDFQALDKGDKTVVGEKGITLSGGQKARVSLARAVYARADIYLLDDVLSAVDAHVGKAITEQVLSPNGIIGNRTKVLATNSVPVLHQANDIYLLADGKIVEHGDYVTVTKKNGELAKLIKDFGRKKSEKGELSDQKCNEEIEENWKERHEVDKVQTENTLLEATETPLAASPAGVVVRRASITSFDHVYDDDEDEDVNKNENENNELSGIAEANANTTSGGTTALSEEKREKGVVSFKTFIRYIKEANYKLFIVFLICIVINILLNVGETYILRVWSNVNKERNETVDPGFFLGLYFATGALAGFVVYIGYYILWSYCIIKAAAYFHQEMAKAILRSPLSFFDTTPVGRILNRFTQDTDKIDLPLPWSLIMFLQTFIGTIVTFAVIIVTLPAMMILIAIFGLIYYYYSSRYIPTSRELQRLQSVASSPVLAIIQETLNGVDTIKAYDQEARFIHKCKKFIDQRTLVNVVNVDVDRWLSMRLQSISAATIFGAALISVLSLTGTNPITPALLGFVMTYALNVSQQLTALIRAWSIAQDNGVALERIVEYCDLPSEAPMVIEDKRPNKLWPANGAIKFKKYSTSYRQHLPPVLEDIDVAISAREKIGVVGRTGAGKSSLTLGLFRLIEATGGYIEIDDVNVSEIGLYDLRRHLTIIPQEAHTFRASVRENLDPFGEHDDAKLWQVLQLAHLKEHVEKMESDPTDEEKKGVKNPDELPKKRGLDAQIEEGGSNLSAGQKQLLCLARALLNETSKILVLDEATAAVDFQTDKIIQETIREQFKDKTILTIAHRIDTIMDSDKILVLDKGKVAEFDSPQTLLKNKDSIFYSLSKEGGYIK